MASRGMCVNWNELQYLVCATSEKQTVAAPATRSAVAPGKHTNLVPIYVDVGMFIQHNSSTIVEKVSENVDINFALKSRGNRTPGSRCNAGCDSP